MEAGVCLNENTEKHIPQQINHYQHIDLRFAFLLPFLNTYITSCLRLHFVALREAFLAVAQNFSSHLPTFYALKILPGNCTLRKPFHRATFEAPFEPRFYHSLAHYQYIPYIHGHPFSQTVFRFRFRFFYTLQFRLPRTSHPKDSIFVFITFYTCTEQREKDIEKA